MPKKNHARKIKIRKRMAATGESYRQAAQAVDNPNLRSNHMPYSNGVGRIHADIARAMRQVTANPVHEAMVDFAAQEQSMKDLMRQVTANPVHEAMVGFAAQEQSMKDLMRTIARPI